MESRRGQRPEELRYEIREGDLEMIVTAEERKIARVRRVADSIENVSCYRALIDKANTPDELAEEFVRGVTLGDLKAEFKCRESK